MRFYLLLIILLISINSFSQTDSIPPVTIGEPADTVTNSENNETPAIQIITVGEKDESTEDTNTESENTETPSISIINTNEEDLNKSTGTDTIIDNANEESETPSISIISADDSTATEPIEDKSSEIENNENQPESDNPSISIISADDSTATEPEVIETQQQDVPEPEINNTDYSTITPTEEPTESTSVYKPIISYGNGLFTYFGDVNDNYRKNPVVGRIGYHIGLSRNINDFLELNFTSIHGFLTGNERSDERYINFQTEILSGGVSVYYNFSNFIKKTLPFSPFVALGIEYFDYNSKGDLYDANGNYYYYWKDGSLRDVPENSPKASNSVILNRDYNYETDLRDLNLDGLGKYQQVAVAIPIDIGFDMPVNKWLTLRFGNQFHFSFSDLIDNVNSKAEGIRHGGKSKDKFMYSYFTLRFNLFTGSSDSNEDDIYNSADFEGINGDEDADGVSDFDDLCPATASGITVDEKGCPKDSDADGVADYLDQEENTSKDAYYVDVNGVGKSEQDYENSISTDTIAVLAQDVYKYYPSLKKGVKQFTSVFIQVPKKFRMFDINKDEYISPDELSKAIDLFFDFDSNLTIDDIYELNEFFFSQDLEDEDL